MKPCPFAFMLLAVGILIPPLWFAQKLFISERVPQYDIWQEGKFNGVVDEVKNRTCPISGGIGSHLMVKIDNKTYEVHVAPVKFVKMYEAAFQKGDAIEIVGVTTKFQDIDAILPRMIKRGNDVFVFRDLKGTPFW